MTLFFTYFVIHLTMRDIEDIGILRKKISGHQHIKFRKDYANYLEEYPNLDEFCHQLISKLSDKNIKKRI